MSESDSINQLYYSEFHPNYFDQDQSELEKNGNVKQTKAYDQEQEQPNPDYSQKQSEVKLSKGYSLNREYGKPDNTQLPARTKKIISVGQKFRSSYMQAKKGLNEQTNDLSINVCTLMKTFCEQFQTFQEMQQIDVKLIRQFREGKSNIETLKKLMGTSQKEQSLSIFEECERQLEEKGSNLSEFFSRKLQQTQIITNLLNNKKMKFNNKLTFIKYLEVIKKSVQNPEKFKSWKNCQY